MSLAYVRQHYGVPAFRGTAIVYTGGDAPRTGVIVGTARSRNYEITPLGFWRLLTRFWRGLMWAGRRRFHELSRFSQWIAGILV